MKKSMMIHTIRLPLAVTLWGCGGGDDDPPGGGGSPIGMNVEISDIILINE